MKKNKKQEDKKYITLESGEDFRTIAKIMTENGFKMNHATARNQVIDSLEDLISGVGVQINKNKRYKVSDIDKMFKDHNLGDDFSDLLYLAFEEYKKDITK